MSYQAFVKPIMSFLSGIDNPRILEIGVDKGQTSIPLIHNLTLECNRFLYEGIDLVIQDSVIQSLTAMLNVSVNQLEDSPNVNLIKGNSLSLLQVLIEENLKYDLVLVDGDHNYHTVSKELEMIQDLCHPTSLIICDDYFGKWEKKDLYYSEYEHYSDVSDTTPRKNTKKQGVRSAVDDFVKNSDSRWSCYSMLVGDGDQEIKGADFCILHQKNFIKLTCEPGANYMYETKLKMEINGSFSHRFIDSPLRSM